MTDRSRATWSLSEIKKIIKDNSVFGQVCIGTCGYNPVWQSCRPTIREILMKHNNKFYYLYKLPPPQ
jgi:hypothetical protein